ncbi:hypothetical protein GSI_11010 [Ganoderma sinense ZZ0214-1]|uniref:F-box domain-containing protein n=1 Tax=Ganoderma sinense ZZ0214-1 TaxID=1077348 RepID=A0A2G8S264_9APHY|nr:hypothetical protein GSI_11010 [Ganoderma sinense ZZ0214-1]
MNATAPANPADSDPQPRVPLDIQLAIVEACPDVRTSLMLISTHKTLRKWGARLALQSPSTQVRLYSSAAARSFFVFCAAQGLPSEPSSPLAVLHTLEITLATVNPVGMGYLIILLGNVPRLTSLTLYDPEEALCRHPSLYGALRRLRTLKVFRVYEAKAMAFKLVSEIASALEAVSIEPNSQTVFDTFLNLGVLLGRHKDTLTRFKTLAMNLRSRTQAIHAESVQLVVFEKVQELVLPLCFFPGASHYIKAFPNATSLDLGTHLTKHFRKRIEAMDHFRSWTLSAVMGMHGDPLDPQPDCWPSLETVRGGLFDIYTFGNSCSVAALLIDGLIESEWMCVPSVVERHYPVILRLSVTPSLCVELWEKEWRKMCSVKHLVLQFVVDDQVDLGDLTDRAIHAVGSFVHCKHVFLDFKATNPAARSRLLGLDHLSLRYIIEDCQLGPYEIAIRSPAKTTYWSHHPDSGEMEKSLWDGWDMPAKTNFQTLNGFPKNYVTDDWV